MFNNNSKIKVTIDNEVMYVNEGTQIKDILKDQKKEILAVKINNEIHSIYYHIIEECNCEKITYYSNDGERIYSNSLKFLMIMACYNLFKNAKLEFTNKMGRDYFVNVEGIKITSEIVSKIKKEMMRIILCDLKVKKHKVSFEVAKRIYRNMNALEQLENFRIKTKEMYTFYECNGYYNYLYGLIVPSTGYIKAFDIKMYKDGIVLILPSKNDIYSVSNDITYNKVYDEFKKFRNFARMIGINNVATLNLKTLDNTIGEVIRLAEADHNRRLVEVISEITKKPDIKIIFISGPSSSGKTTFSQKLAIQLRIIGKKAYSIAMDNYFQDDENVPLDENGNKDYENIQNVDIRLFSNHMSSLLDLKSIEIPEYNFEKSKKEYNGNILKLEENEILIIEGIHALNPLITSIVEQNKIFKIYLAPLVTIGFDNVTKVSSNDTRLIRRIVRDADIRGRLAEDTLKSWDFVRRGEEKNIFPYVNEADVIYNTNLIYELGVLKPFAENLLLRVGEESRYYSDARRLYKLLQNFRTIETSEIPFDSVIKEFVGKGCFYR